MPGDLAEAAAFLKIPVAETEVDRVALPRKMRLRGDQGFDVVDDPFHFFLRLRNDPGDLAMNFLPFGSRMTFDFPSQMIEQLAGMLEQATNFLFTPRVPRRMRNPTAEGVRVIDFAFAGDHPIRQKRKLTFEEAL